MATRDLELRDASGRWCTMRVRPYQTQDNRIEGAVITLIDVHELHTSLAQVEQAARFSEGLNAVLAALEPGAPDAGMPGVLAEAARVIEADVAVVWKREDKGWRTLYGAGLPQRERASLVAAEDLPQAALALRSRGPVVLRAPDVVASADGPRPTRFELRPLVVAPLLVGDEVLGVLTFEWHDSAHQVDDGHADFAAKVASLIALALLAGQGA